MLWFVLPETFRPLSPRGWLSQEPGRRFAYGANETSDSVSVNVPNLPKAPGKGAKGQETQLVQVEVQPRQEAQPVQVG